MQRAMAFDVHEIAFAPLAIATLILAMERRHWPLFWIAAWSLVLIKEDLIPLLAGVGAYLWVRGDTRRGVTLVVASVVLFAAIVGVVVPAFSDSGTYEYTSAYMPLARAPWRLPMALVTPPLKLATVFLWLAPFLFLPLASPLILLSLPIVLERFLSASPHHWGPVFHYSAPLAPILVMSAGSGLARIGRARPDVVNAAAAAILVLCAVLPGRQPLWRILAAGHYRQTTMVATGREVLAMVPPSASVVAQAAIVPHLSQRRVIHMLDLRAPDSDYVIAQVDLNPWPNSSRGEIEQLTQERERQGYAVIFARDGWTLLRRLPESPNGGPVSGR